jgi:phage terminase large subunit-like protein
MTSQLPVPLVGVQRPRILVRPPSVGSSGREAVDLAAHAGLVLDPWQQFVLEVGLAERADGKWAAFETAVVVSRQNGKGAIFEALALAKLVLFGRADSLFIYSSHEFKTSREAFRRIGMLIDQTPELSARLLRPVRNPSEFGYDFRNGSRLRFFARSGGSGRGWSADDVFFEEAFRLGPEMMAALLPTLSTRENPQVWYASSAALADSTQLHALRRRALAGEGVDRLAYMEFSAPEDADVHDREAWALANPALGYRLTEEFISSEVDALPDAVFRRERLSIPDLPSGEALFPMHSWAACADPDSRAKDPIALAVDVAPDRSSASIAAAGTRADGKPHVTIIESHAGTDWVVPRVAALVEKWQPSAVALDSAGPAGALVQDFTAADVDVVTATARDLTNACGRFYDLVVAGELRHRDEATLNIAAAAARRRNVGDAWAYTRRRDSDADISPLYAATLALWAHAEHGGPREPGVWFI